MVKIVSTSIWDSTAQTIVNPVNTVGVMGAGLALEFKQKYPEMHEKYRQFCLSGDLTIGKLWLYKTQDRWILNFPTKSDWRKPSEFTYLAEGLNKFIKTYKQLGITSISFPQLGCGKGGLAWDSIKGWMILTLSRADIPVYIHIR